MKRRQNDGHYLPTIASESCHAESHDCSKKKGKRPAGTVLNALNGVMSTVAMLRH